MPPERYALALASSSAGTGSPRGRELREDRLERLGQLRRVHARGDLQRTGVGVLDHARADVVGEPLAPRERARNRRLDMPSPRTALSTASVHASAWSRGSAGHAIASCAWDVSRLPTSEARARGQRRRRLDRGIAPLPDPNAAVARPTASSCDRSPAIATTVLAGPVGRAPEVADRATRQGADPRLVAADLAPQRAVAEDRLSGRASGTYSAGSSR